MPTLLFSRTGNLLPVCYAARHSMPEHPQDPALPPLDALRSPDSKVMNRAWIVAVAALSPRLMNFLAPRLTNADDRTDTAQQMLMEVAKRVCRGEELKQTIPHLMFTIAQRRVYDRYRHQRRHPEDPVAVIPETAHDAKPPGDYEDEALHRCVQALPERLRELVTAYYFLGIEQATLAGLNGIPSGTINSRMDDARRRLRDCLTSARV